MVAIVTCIRSDNYVIQVLIRGVIRVGFGVIEWQLSLVFKLVILINMTRPGEYLLFK